MTCTSRVICICLYSVAPIAIVCSFIFVCSVHTIVRFAATTVTSCVKRMSCPATVCISFFTYLASVRFMYPQMCTQSPWVMDVKFLSLNYIMHFEVLNVFFLATQIFNFAHILSS